MPPARPRKAITALVRGDQAAATLEPHGGVERAGDRRGGRPRATVETPEGRDPVDTAGRRWCDAGMIVSERAVVVVAHGPRAAELELLGTVARLAPRDAHDLALPVRVIVPSSSLRRHVVARLVATSGRALAGVIVETLQQAALEILERAGEDGGHGAAPFEILVRRAAARERGLRQALADLDDGYGTVEAAVRDLLDAGYSPTHREAGAREDRRAARPRRATPAAAGPRRG